MLLYNILSLVFLLCYDRFPWTFPRNVASIYSLILLLLRWLQWVFHQLSCLYLFPIFSMINTRWKLYAHRLLFRQYLYIRHPFTPVTVSDCIAHKYVHVYILQSKNCENLQWFLVISQSILHITISQSSNSWNTVICTDHMFCVVYNEIWNNYYITMKCFFYLIWSTEINSDTWLQ